ncbi:hypothetical protein [Myxococcus sp. AB025B]|uniref:hypothetical protein n=1 Tax=Myxococcus sp. AB025B TaxID=2562794 RepID=UPI00114465AE|nr:hypothetical protein [Myxococcus sp. AB025B]
MSRHLVLLSTWLFVGASLMPSPSHAGPAGMNTDVPLHASMAEPIHASRPVRAHSTRDGAAWTHAVTLANPHDTPAPGMKRLTSMRAWAAQGGLSPRPPTTSPPLGASSTYQPVRPEDVPLSTGAWVAHGGLALLPLTGIWGATRVGGDTRLGAASAQTATGMLGGYLPSRLLFFRPATPGSGRWMDLEVAAVGGGLLFTPPLAALGTWGLGELAFGRSEDRADAYVGALAGAAAGTLLAAAVDGLLTKLSEPSTRLQAVRQLIALAFVGSGATLGYQWAGGGPRSHQPTR